MVLVQLFKSGNFFKHVDVKENLTKNGMKVSSTSTFQMNLHR